jgi:predicted phage tail protein
MSDATATSHVFSGLSAGQYSAQVLATNAIGAGARSVESTSVTITGVTPASTTPASGGGGGGGAAPTSTPSPTATPSTKPSTVPTNKPSPGTSPTVPQSKVVPGKSTPVKVEVSSKVSLSQAQTKIVSSSGQKISNAVIKIDKNNKVNVTLPKNTKPGTYTLQIKTKNGKTYTATVVVPKK